MSDDLHHRIEGVLEDAESALESLPEDDAEWADLIDQEGHPIREVADDAAALIEDTDSESLLDALSLTSLPDGSEAESIPQAIAQGESEKVATLQAISRLSKLSREWDSGDESAFEEELRDVRETLASAVDVDIAEESADESADERAEDADETRSEDESTEAGGLDEALQSAMSDAFDGFGDEFREAKAQLEGLVGDESAETAGGEDAEEEAKADEKAEADEDTDDGGLLGESESSGSTRHSTMAPPPSKRADMRGVKRHSTMPDRNNRSGMGD